MSRCAGWNACLVPSEIPSRLGVRCRLGVKGRRLGAGCLRGSRYRSNSGWSVGLVPIEVSTRSEVSARSEVPVQCGMRCQPGVEWGLDPASSGALARRGGAGSASHPLSSNNSDGRCAERRLHVS